MFAITPKPETVCPTWMREFQASPRWKPHQSSTAGSRGSHQHQVYPNPFPPSRSPLEFAFLRRPPRGPNRVLQGKKSHHNAKVK